MQLFTISIACSSDITSHIPSHARTRIFDRKKRDEEGEKEREDDEGEIVGGDEGKGKSWGGEEERERGGGKGREPRAEEGPLWRIGSDPDCLVGVLEEVGEEEEEEVGKVGREREVEGKASNGGERWEEEDSWGERARGEGERARGEEEIPGGEGEGRELKSTIEIVGSWVTGPRMEKSPRALVTANCTYFLIY